MSIDYQKDMVKFSQQKSRFPTDIKLTEEAKHSSGTMLDKTIDNSVKTAFYYFLQVFASQLNENRPAVLRPMS
jgi:hypothetical protein